MPRRTKANLDAERASGFLGPTEPRQRDDDEMSVASTASTFSAVSINPTAHAARRQGERDIETREVQRAKKEGRISLAIRFAGDEHSNKQATETAALEWGARVTAEFEGLQMGEVKTRGAPEDRRIEVEIRGPESRSGSRTSPTLQTQDVCYTCCDSTRKRSSWLWRGLCSRVRLD